MALFSKLGLSLWINTEFADKSWILLAIISVGIFFNGLAQVPHTLLQASGNVRVTAIVHSFEFIFYIILLFILLKLFGIVGAALTFLFRVILDYLVLNLFANKALKQV
jgi:O-antigen/teichoic acid export membrane protein